MVEVDVAVDPGCEASLLLLYDPEYATGVTPGPQGLKIRLGNGLVFNHSLSNSTRATVRIVNDRQEIDFYFRLLDQPWQRTQESAEISGMHHNILGGFLDVRPALSAWGTGGATFRNFRFWPELKIPT